MGADRRLTAAALLCLALSLGGCWDRAQLEDQAYVIALGVDQGTTSPILVTVRVALIQRLAIGVLGGQDIAGPTTELLTAEGDTITQALLVLNAGMTRRLDFRHLTVVLVGEELARAGLRPAVRELARIPWVRESVLLRQVRGPAHGVLRAFRAVGEFNLARAAEGIYLQTKALHMAPPLRMHQFILRLEAPGGDPILPVEALNPRVGGEVRTQLNPPPGSALPGEVARSGGNPVDIAGTAVFRGDRLVGYLTVDETQGLLALRGEMGKAYVTLPDPLAPGHAVTLRFHQENLPRYRAYFAGRRPQVDVRLLLEGEVLAVPGDVDYTRAKARINLERTVAYHAERTLRELLAKLRNWGADPVGFGHFFRGHFATWQEWIDFDWMERVWDLQVNVTVDMRIRRYGSELYGDRAGESD